MASPPKRTKVSSPGSTSQPEMETTNALINQRSRLNQHQPQTLTASNQDNNGQSAPITLALNIITGTDQDQGKCSKTEDFDIAKPEEFGNWISCYLAFRSMKKSIMEKVVEKLSERYFKNLIKKMESKFGTLPDCSQQTYFPLRKKINRFNCHCPLNKNCPNCLAVEIAKTITEDHRCNNVLWKNSDACQWTSNPWEVIKCFATVSGPIDKHSVTDTDFSGLLGILIGNGRTFEILDINCQENTYEDTVKRALNSRNNIIHQPDYQISKEKLDTFFANFKELLDLFTKIVDTSRCSEHLFEKKRNELSINNRDILEKAFTTGLTSSKKENASRITSLSEETGLTEKQIQTWIGNRRWKEAKAAYPRKQKNFPIKRGPSAYTLFTRTIKRGTKAKDKYLKEVAEKWKNISADEKENFRKEALVCRKDPCRGLEEVTAAKHHISVLKNACYNLSQIGYSISGILLKEGTVPEIFGSMAGVKFVEDKDLIKAFQLACNQTTIEVTPKPKTRAALKEEVRKILNACWESASGGSKCISYAKILNGSLPWRLEGLPDGINFKDPSSYNISSLKGIHNAKDKLKFVRSNPLPQNESFTVNEHGPEPGVVGSEPGVVGPEPGVVGPEPGGVGSEPGAFVPSTSRSTTGKSVQMKKGKRRMIRQKQDLQEFEVDFLVKDRNDGKEFLVQWKGYDETQRTWEPAEEMPVSSINDYWRKRMHVLSNFSLG